MIINLPHVAPMDTDKIGATLETQVRYSFAQFTKLTAKDFTHCDKLFYIDNLTRNYIRRLDASQQVRGLIHDAVDYSIENAGTMPDDDDLLSWEFMEQCYEAGERDSRLYQHYIDGRSEKADERALKVIAEIVKIVMNWEPEVGNE